jgi:hypothetical protein
MPRSVCTFEGRWSRFECVHMVSIGPLIARRLPTTCGKRRKKQDYTTSRKYWRMSGVWEDGLPDSPWLSTGFGVVESVISVLLGLVDGISWLVSMRPLSILPAWMSNPAGACVHEKAALSCHRRALRDRLTLPASGSWLREPGMIVGAIDISCLHAPDRGDLPSRTIHLPRPGRWIFDGFSSMPGQAAEFRQIPLMRNQPVADGWCGTLRILSIA